MSMLADTVDFVIGVDTHKHTHTAAIVEASTGAAIAERTVSCDLDGYDELLELADKHPGTRIWALEGTGSFGAGLTRHLLGHDEAVIEVERPHRPVRRNGAKSDPIDAVRAARDALSRDHNGEPRSQGTRAALSVLVTTRRSAVTAAAEAQVQLHAVIVAAPHDLRARFQGQTTLAMVKTASRLRLNPSWDDEHRATATAMRSLARRCIELTDEANSHRKAITAIVRSWRPDLLEVQGIGPIVAATVLCAWSHPGRLRNEGTFAALAGVAPIPASSGLTTRHRLNRHGDRQLNQALHTIVISRLLNDPTTQAYRDRRRAEGRSDREIKRCLKRYIARQLYRQLESPPTIALDNP